MSQASKHVEWCLNKAKKEIEECKKFGKKEKHRGLLKTNPDIDEAKRHLAKAEHNLDGISRFKEVGFLIGQCQLAFTVFIIAFLPLQLNSGMNQQTKPAPFH